MHRGSAPEVRWRVYLLLGLWLVLFAVVLARLVQVQVLLHAAYAARAERQTVKVDRVQARRGAIQDRNGETLAEDVIHYSLAVRPNQVEDSRKLVRVLSEILGRPASYFLQRLKAHPKYVYLAHRLSEQTAEKIRQAHLSGVELEEHFSRYYPFAEAAAQTIGFCDFDNRARAGLELKYDDRLKGQSGLVVYLRDARGHRFQNLDIPAQEPIDGKTLITTLDITYQQILEEELRQAVEAHQADHGSAILMDPHTGRVLAIANYPGFDPNHYNQFPMETYQNRAISAAHEPGSTFKMVALAVLLEQLKLDLDKETVYCEDGRYRLHRKVIRDHKPFGRLTLREVFEHSSNIGVIKIARRFRAPIFYRYARDFGFGAFTGIDLPAESQGILHTPDQYHRNSLYYMSIGYEVSATPLQIATAYAAVANGGKLMQPYVVEKIVDAQGRVVYRNKPQVIRQVISPLTARYITDTFQGVVERGTGRTAAIPGVHIAGKTGTAQKLDPETGRYSSSAHVASFVGYFPAESPRFVLMVSIDRPRKGYYGSQVAAPAFRNMALRIIGLPRQEDLLADVSEADIPPAIEGDVVEEPDAPRVLKTSFEQKKAPKSDQSARERRKPAAEPEPRLWVSASGKMPDLVGLTLREALQRLDALPVNPTIEGHGVVVQQFPRPGTVVSRNSKIRLVCQAS